MAKRKVTQRGPLGNLQSTYEEEAEEDAVLKDGETLRVPMWLMDGSPNPALSPLQQAVAASQNKLLVSDGSNDPLAMHRPGFRYSTDPAERAAADAALAEAYAARELADANAWQTSDDHPINTQGRGLSPGKKEGGSCSIDGQRGTLVREGDRLVCVPDKARDARSVTDAREEAYRLYDEEQQHAWQS